MPSTRFPPHGPLQKRSSWVGGFVKFREEAAETDGDTLAPVDFAFRAPACAFVRATRTKGTKNRQS
jgi:hypothetical protein